MVKRYNKSIITDTYRQLVALITKFKHEIGVIFATLASIGTALTLLLKQAEVHVATFYQPHHA